MSASEEQIVEALPMVRRLASRYRGTPLGDEDALGVGAVALVEAGRRFEHTRGVPFPGYAFPRVKWAMQDAACGRSGARGARPAAETPCDPDVIGETVCDLRASRPDGCLDLFVGAGQVAQPAADDRGPARLRSAPRPHRQRPRGHRVEGVSVTRHRPAAAARGGRRGAGLTQAP